MMGINLDSAIQRAGGLHGNRQDGSAVEPAEEVAQSEEVRVTEPVGLGEEQKFGVDADQAVEQESQEPTAVSPAVSQPAKPKRAVKRGASDVLQIPAFPKSLMAMIRSDIPEAQNNSDALAAWVYVKSGRRADVSPEVKELAKKYKGPADEDMLGALLEKVTRIARSLLSQYRKGGEELLRESEVWLCTVCGFVYIGRKPPELCPVCKVPSWKFTNVEGGEM